MVKNKESKFKNSTKIFGNTDFKNYLSKNYMNIPFKKTILSEKLVFFIK